MLWPCLFLFVIDFSWRKKVSDCIARMHSSDACTLEDWYGPTAHIVRYKNLIYVFHEFIIILAPRSCYLPSSPPGRLLDLSHDRWNWHVLFGYFAFNSFMVARKYYVALNILFIFLFLAWLQNYILLMSLFMSLSYHGFTLSIIAMDLMICFYSSMCTALCRWNTWGSKGLFYLPGLFKLLHKCNPSPFAFFLFKLNWPSYMFSHI